MQGLRRECSELFRQWVIGVVFLSILTGIGGAAISPGTSAGSRIVAAAVGTTLALGVATIVVFAIACVRTPLRKHREHHRLSLLGRECQEIAHSMTKGAALREGAGGGTEFVEETTALGRYTAQFASRVFYVARELEEYDVLTRDEREELAAMPENATTYYEKILRLLDLGASLR